MLGLGLLVIGYVGTFFGNIIKAAVSRQREFLADASSVQYTRNPEGITGALMRIATHNKRSYLDNPSSMEISHALFEEGMATRFKSLYATHPPIEQRIKAILPNWDGNYDLVEPVHGDDPIHDGTRDDQSSKSDSSAQRQKAEAILTGATGILVANAAINQIGQPGEIQVHQAKQLLSDIPRELIAAAHAPSSARAVIYLLLIDTDEAIQKSQLQFLEHSSDHGIFEELQMLMAGKLRA